MQVCYGDSCGEGYGQTGETINYTLRRCLCRAQYPPLQPQRSRSRRGSHRRRPWRPCVAAGGGLSIGLDNVPAPTRHSNSRRVVRAGCARVVRALSGRGHVCREWCRTILLCVCSVGVGPYRAGLIRVWCVRTTCMRWTCGCRCRWMLSRPESV